MLLIDCANLGDGRMLHLAIRLSVMKMRSTHWDSPAVDGSQPQQLGNEISLVLQEDDCACEALVV